MEPKFTWKDLEVGNFLSENPISKRTRRSKSESKSTSTSTSTYTDDRDDTNRAFVRMLLVLLQKIIIFAMALSAFCYAAKARVAYNKYNGTTTLDLDLDLDLDEVEGHSAAQQAWPERMALGEHNALLGTLVVGWVLPALFGCQSVMNIEDMVLMFAFSFTMPYVWGYDLFKTGVFATEPDVQSTLRACVCLMSEKVSSSVGIPYCGDMCYDLVGPPIICLYKVYP